MKGRVCPMNFRETTVKQNVFYKGSILTLREDDAKTVDGRPCTRVVVEHPGGVCVVAITDDEKVLLVRQWRYPFEEETWELPAGKLELTDTDVALAAARELKEEAGVTAKTWQFLGNLYPTPGFCTEIDRIFVATDLTFGEPEPDEDEFLTLAAVPLKEALARVMNGDLPDAKTQIGILKVCAARGITP